MLKRIRGFGRVLSVMSVVSMLLLTACATTEAKRDDMEARVVARWTALLASDFATAYEFLSPGYRSSVTLAQYQRSLILQKVKWTNARYIESDCAESACKVKISMDFVLYGALPGVRSFEGTQVIEESWVQTGDDWYFVPEL